MSDAAPLHDVQCCEKCGATVLLLDLAPVLMLILI